jgi:hypothetical protein
MNVTRGELTSTVAYFTAWQCPTSISGVPVRACMADGSRFIHNTQKLGGTEQRRLGSSFAWVTLHAIFFFKSFSSLPTILWLGSSSPAIVRWSLSSSSPTIVRSRHTRTLFVLSTVDLTNHSHLTESFLLPELQVLLVEVERISPRAVQKFRTEKIESWNLEERFFDKFQETPKCLWHFGAHL